MIGVALLVAAIPYVARIRHPRQKPLAAYLIFVSLLVLGVAVFFNLLTWVVRIMGLETLLGNTGPALVFIAICFLPAIVLATWFARKPPSDRGNPPG